MGNSTKGSTMSNDEGSTSTTGTTEGTGTTEAVTYEKGSWQDKMSKSTTLLDRSTKARKAASAFLWDGAQSAIDEWMPSASTDVSAENLYAEVLSILGTPRKGDASKIKTVALAVRNHGLVVGSFDNLSKAYAEATRLTKTVQQQADEDSAADKAVEALADSAPKTASTPEAAAKVLLSKGIDGAVVAVLDALGANNFDAHRAFIRAVSTEVSSRVQASKPKPAPKAGPKAGAKQATKTASAKAKPVAVSKSKGDPNKRGLPTKAKPVAAKAKSAPVSEPVEAGESVGESAIETVAPQVKQARRAVPVKRAAR